MTQRPDETTATASGGTTFKPHSEGTFAMRNVDVVNMGCKIDQYPGKPPKESPKVTLVFASGECNEDGSLIIVSSEMTNSMFDTANLRQFLESWRGKSYTPEQADAGVPLHKLHGHPALITIEHVRTKRDRLFANIRAVSPLPAGMAIPDKKLLDEYVRPDFLEERKKYYADEVEKYRASVHRDTPKQTETLAEDDEPDEDEDDLPF